jgi:hypothetical protein
MHAGGPAYSGRTAAVMGGAPDGGEQPQNMVANGWTRRIRKKSPGRAKFLDMGESWGRAGGYAGVLRRPPAQRRQRRTTRGLDRGTDREPPASTIAPAPAPPPTTPPTQTPDDRGTDRVGAL